VPHPEPSALEREIRDRFAVREETFRHGDVELGILVPTSAETLIDECEFGTDERLPYWADLWPSARALARMLAERPPSHGPVLEIGAGVALPALVLLAAGVDVVASDWYEDALLFARCNALRNGLPPLNTALLDWRDPPPRRFPLVIAADVLYEERNAGALARFLPQATAPGGTVLLADPGRVHAPKLLRTLRDHGWAITTEERSEAAPEITASTIQTIRLHRLERLDHLPGETRP
jgi:predicted nicotinamide N-methyase